MASASWQVELATHIDGCRARRRRLPMAMGRSVVRGIGLVDPYPGLSPQAARPMLPYTKIDLKSQEQDERKREIQADDGSGVGENLQQRRIPPTGLGVREDGSPALGRRDRPYAVGSTQTVPPADGRTGRRLARHGKLLSRSSTNCHLQILLGHDSEVLERDASPYYFDTCLHLS